MSLQRCQKDTTFIHESQPEAPLCPWMTNYSSDDEIAKIIRVVLAELT